MTDYLENPRCGDSNSSFSLEFSSDMDEMEGGGLFRRSPSPTNLNFIAISDPEGYDILAQAGGFKKDKELYVCGDLIDSTMDIGIPIYNPYVKVQEGKIFGEIIDKPTVDFDRLAAKSCNLHNIALCMVHERIHLIFGNRDLNKLKCKFLCKLDGKGEFIDKFNNGNIDLRAPPKKYEGGDSNPNTFESDYTKLKEEIKNNNLIKKPWEIHRMTQWYPFWNINNPAFDANKWKSTDDYSDNFS